MAPSQGPIAHIIALKRTLDQEMQMLRTITEAKHTLAGKLLEFPCSAVEVSEAEAIILYRLTKEVVVENLRLPAGTVSLGYFWAARPYNIYHWLTPEGVTLGYYINIGDQVQIADGRIAWRDLVVDLLILPEERLQILDENELPAELEPALRATIMRIKEQLAETYPAIIAEIQQRSEMVFAKLDI
jgi:protein associated with RNAse G/E